MPTESSGSATPGARRTGSAGTSPGTSVGSTPSASSAARPAAPTRSSALPPAGAYSYKLSGQTKTALGSRSDDGSSTLTVDPASRGRQHSVEDGSNGKTDQIIVADSTGIRLADLKSSGQGVDVEFRPTHPVLLVPAGARLGQAWSWQMKSTDGKYTLNAHLSIASLDDVVTVGGKRVHAIGIKSHLVLTGSDVSMTTDQRDEFARGLPVLSERAVSDGTAYGVKFHSDITKQLESTAPH